MSKSDLDINLDARLEQDALVLQLGESVLDRMNAKDFRDRAAELVAGHPGPVHLDLRSVNFIDSSGIGAILHLGKMLPEGLPLVKLLGVAPAVLSVLELVRVHRYFEIVPKS